MKATMSRTSSDKPRVTLTFESDDELRFFYDTLTQGARSWFGAGLLDRARELKNKFLHACFELNNAE